MSYREGVSKGGNTPTWTSQRKSSHIYRILTPLGKNLVLSYLFLFLPCFRGEKKINQELAIFLLVQSTYLLNYIIDWTTRMDWLLSRFSVSSQPTHSQFSSPPLTSWVCPTPPPYVHTPPPSPSSPAVSALLIMCIALLVFRTQKHIIRYREDIYQQISAM